MPVPQGRNQKKHKHKRKLRTCYPAVRGRRLEYEAEANNLYRPGDKLGEMLLKRPRLEDMLSRDPMGFLDRPRGFLDIAETNDPDEADLEDFDEDFDEDFE